MGLFDKNLHDIKENLLHNNIMQDPGPIYPTDPSKTLGEIIDNIAGTGQKIKNTCRKIKSLFHNENDKELRQCDIIGITKIVSFLMIITVFMLTKILLYTFHQKTQI